MSDSFPGPNVSSAHPRSDITDVTDVTDISPAPRGSISTAGGQPHPAPAVHLSERHAKPRIQTDTVDGTVARREGLRERIPIVDVWPSIDGGGRPAAACEGEYIPIRATIFREGHTPIRAEVTVVDPNGDTQPATKMKPDQGSADRWEGLVRIDRPGLWHFTIRAWSDPWVTWLERAHVKIPRGIDDDFELREGAWILSRASAELPVNAQQQRHVLAAAAVTMRDGRLPTPVRFAAANVKDVLEVMESHPIREQDSNSGPWPLLAQRRRALVGAWYEFFPRSEGARLSPPRSGNFRSALTRLARIADMGFDVVYLPPIHPIGQTHRKGKNNSVTARPGDPGSPWAIGSGSGGHDSIHPDLGSWPDFDAFVHEAHRLGMEVALDLALQASPDHPWVAEHPEWFTRQHDGSIAYAENPPKKYQDIYPLNFDQDPEGIYWEIERIVRVWAERGIRIFRVDNPHTKPLWLWDRLLNAFRESDPDVLFLAEAFTKPAMMKALAEIGFHQSYTYFTWRNAKHEIADYLGYLAGEASAAMRPNLFANTPDILPDYLQHGGPAAFAIRATLAATLAPTYGIYSGFELFEHVAVKPGSEEYLNSEKYQYLPRDWASAEAEGQSLGPYLRLLNAIRRENVALQDLRSLHFHFSEDDNIIAYSKRVDGNTVLVACLLDPHRERSSTIHWNMAALGLEDDDLYVARDLISGHSWTWGRHTYVQFQPWQQVAHVATIASAS